MNKNKVREYNKGKDFKRSYHMKDEYYVREEKIIEKTEIEKETELVRAIIKTREELKVANCNFEYAQGDLIDYYTYQIKAEES